MADATFSDFESYPDHEIARKLGCTKAAAIAWCKRLHVRPVPTPTGSVFSGRSINLAIQQGEHRRLNSENLDPCPATESDLAAVAGR